MNFTESLWATGANVSLGASGAVEDEGEPLYEVPTAVVVLLSLCYGSVSVLAVAGNALVMWVVATSRRMQNVTNCFIANLALADIVIGLFAIPFQFQAALLQRWSLPAFMCPFCPFVRVLSVNVSVFTLTAIAVDRHRAILHPLGARPSKLRARLEIAAIWAVGAAAAAPIAAALRVELVVPGGGGGGAAAAAGEGVDAVGAAGGGRLGEPRPFCRNARFSDAAMLTYGLMLVALQYATPLCIISVVYARVALRLWGSRAPGNAQGTRDAALMRNKKKVIKMLAMVVALFALCWLPLQTYNFLEGFLPQINKYRYINIIWFCCDWLAMSNSCYNPFIYSIYNEKFQREFRVRLRLCSRRCRPADQLAFSRELSELERATSTRGTHASTHVSLHGSAHGGAHGGGGGGGCGFAGGAAHSATSCLNSSRSAWVPSASASLPVTPRATPAPSASGARAAARASPAERAVWACSGSVGDAAAP